MALPVTAAITGAATTPLTSPTFTLASDIANAGTLAYTVSAVGGSGGTGSVHSVSAPWNIRIKRPAVFKTLRDLVYSTAGKLVRAPRNNYSTVQKRLVPVDAGGSMDWAEVSFYIVVPAGAETFAATHIAEMLSLHNGMTYSKCGDLKVLATTGSMN